MPQPMASEEAWGITINPYHGSGHNLIENCEVSHFTATNYCDLSAIAIWGSGVITNNTVIQEEPCDTTYAIEELSGSISGNTTIGCSIFSYMDNASLNINNLSVNKQFNTLQPIWNSVDERIRVQCEDIKQFFCNGKQHTTLGAK